ncbi:MAG: tetratricopeptide repeat protein [Bacteroidales bacterium]|nr:tetratricopeptide repeat protein [Bacteroidales bacterium]MDT8373543.1 tetratricopeptide repeat protein [Bacteroidales bacterium]
MASLIPGYNYDIFISYRQKDNKYDGWVTEFVEHLKSELEATFKEEISVYFDISPHDGLLETHDVDESLKEKLKCLIFIPIISRTYCDPKSFAWVHEFRAFVEEASNDRFGLKVKLPGGNVAMRVMAVQIHELKADDRSLVENVLGGFLRPIEFIYSEPGVNRPLTPNDSEEKNLHRISYRNQINKVANAVDEVISGLIKASASGSKGQETEAASPHIAGTGQIHPDTADASADSLRKGKPSPQRKKRLALTTGTPVIILALLALYLFSGGSTLPFSKRDWILITDFENLTVNPVFDKSLYTAFSLSTGQSRYLNVFTRSRMMETMERMKLGDQKFIDEITGGEIAVREGIGLYIVPSISEVGNRYAVTAKIIGTKSGDLLKSEILYAETEDEILPAIDKLSRKIRKDLGESRYNISLQDKPLTKVTTSSLTALKQYSLGIESHISSDFRSARKYYENALEIDTGFTSAKASLGNVLLQKFNDPAGKELIMEALSNSGSLTDRERYSISAFYAEHVEHDYDKAIANMDVLKRLYPDDPIVRNNLGWYHQQTGKYEIALEEYKQAVKINPEMGLTYSGILWIYGDYMGIIDSSIVWAEKMIADNPDNAWGYFYLGSSWFCRDSIERSIRYFRRASETDPGFNHNLYRLAHAYRRLENHTEAIATLEQILKNNPEETPAYYNLGINFEKSGNLTEATKYFLIYKKIAEEKWLNEYPDYYGTYTSLACVAARLDEMEISQQMLKKAIELDSSQYFSFAQVLCVQGNVSGTLKYLDLALRNGYRDLFSIKANPDLSKLQYDIRLQNLLADYFQQN